MNAPVTTLRQPGPGARWFDAVTKPLSFNGRLRPSSPDLGPWVDASRSKIWDKFIKRELTRPLCPISYWHSTPTSSFFLFCLKLHPGACLEPGPALTPIWVDICPFGLLCLWWEDAEFSCIWTMVLTNHFRFSLFHIFYLHYSAF